MDESSLLIALLRAEVCGVAADIENAPSKECLEKLYPLAARHDLAHIAGQALSKLGLLGQDEASNKLKNAAMQAICRYVQLEYELGQACAVLEQAQIPFIPLKGSVLRSFYPEPWMRTSCDIDILVREEDLDRAVAFLKEKLHYHGNGKSDHDVFLRSPGGTALELHYDTVQERFAGNATRNVLARVWEDAAPVGESPWHMAMSDAMFYFYHMAHMAKHFEVGGCGVRSFLDIWIMNRKMEFNKETRDALLLEGGLLKFAQAAEKLADAWFSGAPMDEKTHWLDRYILRGSIYGGEENRAALGQAKAGGKLRYVFLRRVFMPYKYLKAEHPVLEKHKWLTPVYQVIRWFSVLRRGDVGRRVRELQTNAAVSGKDTASAAELLKYLGL